MPIVLGCIADDFTGATDLASTLVKQGLSVVQVNGTPKNTIALENTEAVVIALKSRTAPAGQAITESLEALHWLEQQGAQQIFFKYCSTFDSTDQGNIGPVTEALLSAMKETFTIACPAFPTNGRTIYQGHLFVGNLLLSDSGMRDHPLTPMRDANLVSVLDRQTKGKVGLIPWTVVSRGSSAIKKAITELKHENVQHAIIDAITDSDLLHIGHACSELKLVTGASGVAMGLPDNFRKQNHTGEATDAFSLNLPGHSAVLAGSCSLATIEQVATARKLWPAFPIDALSLADNDRLVEEILHWSEQHLANGPILIYSTASATEVTHIQSVLGREQAGEMVEIAMGRIAQGLLERGVRKLVVAGGETSGAVVQALKIDAMAIGPEIAPGVPWCRTFGEPNTLLALKSGNFGDKHFFLEAVEQLK
ncbi:MAG: four-carbon acid sugar kinase family protein [Sedimenticola sp.]|nr:four-carbon acid sugar kinase family protein [Sedimenticola sp.]